MRTVEITDDRSPRDMRETETDALRRRPRMNADE